MQSMTGFSSGTIRVPGMAANAPLELAVELKSLNARFFEATTRLPSSLSSLEIDVLNVLKKKLIRGRVFLSVQLVASDEVDVSIVPSLGLAKQYCHAMQQIAQACSLAEPVTLANILAVPDLFVVQKIAFTQEVIAAIKEGIARIADDLCVQRLLEGAILEKDISSRFSVCAQKIEQISKLHDAETIAQKALIAQLQEQHQVAAEPVLVAQLEEAFSVLSKMDISEEITRFHAHLERVHAMLNSSDEEQGKRFDFLLQEFLRETNTIAAKCVSGNISALTIDIKVELEKVREQVQNIV